MDLQKPSKLLPVFAGLARIFLALAATTPASLAFHYHVYLLGGQSNGNGRADAAQLTLQWSRGLRNENHIRNRPRRQGISKWGC